MTVVTPPVNGKLPVEDEKADRSCLLQPCPLFVHTSMTMTIQVQIGDAARAALATRPGMTLLRRFLINPYRARLQHALAEPARAQAAVLDRLLRCGERTRFGREHGLARGMTPAEFRACVPVRSYEALEDPYVNAVFLHGEADVLWPGRVDIFAESSGTSGYRKVIPLPEDAMRHVYRETAMLYMVSLLSRLDAPRFLRGRTIFFAGKVHPAVHNPALTVGDITAVSVARMRRMDDIFRAPDRTTTLWPDWEERLVRMAKRTVSQRIVHLAGNPAWLRHFARIVLGITGMPALRAVWPDLAVPTVGGVNPAPYLTHLQQVVEGEGDPDPVLINEVFNATEGFYAFQIDAGDPVLLPDGGIFYEFVPTAAARAGRFTDAVSLDGVELERDYAMVLSTGCGLWRYLNGDTVRFTARDPWRLRVTGRVGQSLNIALEELSVENADTAVAATCARLGVQLADYTATGLKPSGPENALHLWLIEPVPDAPGDLDPVRFARALDDALCHACRDYAKVRDPGSASGLGFGLDMPVVVVLPPGTVMRWMHRRYGATLSAQSKLPRLAADPMAARELLALGSASDLNTIPAVIQECLMV